MPLPVPPATTKGRTFDTAATLDTDIFGADLTPSDIDAQGAVESTAFRITICLASAAVLRVHTTNAGTEVQADFNMGTALTAGSLFTFTHEVRVGDTVNYQLDTSVTIRWMYVSEVRGENL